MSYTVIPGIQQDHKGRYFQTAIYPNGKAIRIDLKDYAPAKREETFDDRNGRLEADWDEARQEEIKRNLMKRQVKQVNTGHSLLRYRMKAGNKSGIVDQLKFDGLNHGERVEIEMNLLRAYQQKNEDEWVPGEFSTPARVDWMEVIHVD